MLPNFARLQAQCCSVLCAELPLYERSGPAFRDNIKHTVNGFAAARRCKPNLAFSAISNHTNQMNALHIL